MSLFVRNKQSDKHSIPTPFAAGPFQFVTPACVICCMPFAWNTAAAARVVGQWMSKVKDMDWNRIEGNWKDAKGKVKEKWGQLTDDDLMQINGQRDQLEGKIQQRYGLAKDAVRKNVDDWLKAQP
jgi:uncharacterized protein YjbJ (UPF0337 family)